MKLKDKLKEAIRNWLNVIPATQQTVTLMENLSRETEIIRSRLWYQGNADELMQFFKQIKSQSNFWGSVPAGDRVRKIHSGLPSIIVDTLAYIVKSDLDTVDVNSSDWEQIEDKIEFKNLIGEAVADTLIDGDGAFKISVDTDISPFPIVEFVSGENIEIEQSRGITTAVIFKTFFDVENKKYVLHERYAEESIESCLYDTNGNAVPIGSVPCLDGIETHITFNGNYSMAVPLKFYSSKKYKGRGKSIFSGGKSDCFDAHDEVISQWWDALRRGRVKQYIPESLTPRDAENGSLKSPEQFGNDYITISPPIQEGVSQKIEVVQPEINYEAYVTSYTNSLLMCLQGLVSPATLGIDVGKMSSADAQREKKDVTANTRNTITSALEKALPELVEAILKTYDNMRSLSPKEYEVTVSFGEYGAPDFDSRVETVGKAGTYSIMSVETQVNELWGSSRDDEWKNAEVQRIKYEKGIMSADEVSVGDELA